MNVYEAAIDRINYLFDRFDNINVSFSGGKDSGALLNLVLDVANVRNRRLFVVYADFEAMYKETIAFVEIMLQNPLIEPFWVCLPFTFQTGVSKEQTTWKCWDNDGGLLFRREPKNAITLANHPFDFYKPAMYDDVFLTGFSKWISREYGGTTASLIGIRTDESLNRWRAMNRAKATFDGKNWTTRVDKGVYNAYPIFDWHVSDVWAYNFKFEKYYNRAYDAMYMLGTPPYKQRICEPYGPQQKAGLWQWRYIEPETWNVICVRVSGAREYLESGGVFETRGENESYVAYFCRLIDGTPELYARPFLEKIERLIDSGILKLADRNALYCVATGALKANDLSRLTAGRVQRMFENVKEVKGKWSEI